MSEVGFVDFIKIGLGLKNPPPVKETSILDAAAAIQEKTRSEEVRQDYRRAADEIVNEMVRTDSSLDEVIARRQAAINKNGRALVQPLVPKTTNLQVNLDQTPVTQKKSPRNFKGY